MSRFRIPAVVLAAAVLGAPATAQTPIERLLAAYDRKQEVSSESNAQLERLKEGVIGLTDPAKVAIREKAQSVVFKVTQPEYHETIRAKDDALRPRDPVKTMEKLIEEVRREFVSDADWAKMNENQRDYHRQYGAELFDAIVLLMTDRNPPPVLRLNAARLLVPAAETASPAVGRGLLRLLKGDVFKDDKKALAPTPPDVLYYTLRACEAFLNKYDVLRPGTKDFLPDQLTELVGILMGYVEKGVPITDVIAVTSRTPAEQATARTAAIRFYRLQAVRALAKARAEGYVGKTETLHPLFTLARVALRDPAIQPPPSVKEVGEATLGLMAASIGTEVNVDVLAYVVAYGANDHFRVRADKTDEMKVIDWKASAQRFTTAAAAWSAAIQKNPAVQQGGKKAVADAAVKIEKELFSPLLQAANILGGDPNVNEVTQWLERIRPSLPDILINDSRNKTKYLVPYPKR
jgi:hypothetical protein